MSRPVFSLDLNIGKYDSPEALDELLNEALTRWEAMYGSAEAETSLALRFAGVVRRAWERTGERVAILVDEYDKPLLQTMGNEELQEAYRNTLKPFYGVLKSMDGFIKFALLTGVTKFGKVSVFSDLNNLEDLSMWREYVGLCGVSSREIQENLGEEWQEFADAQGMTPEELTGKLAKWYNGYHFTYDSEGIYNPLSLLHAFKRKEFGSYWFETGTPTYLVELLKRSDYDLEQMAHEETDVEVLNSICGDEQPIPVIFQTGYLTIKEYDRRFGVYRLGFPNKEVEEGFVKFLVPYYTRLNKSEVAFEIQKFVREIEAGQPDAFFRRLESFFADTPYELVENRARYYQNVLFIVFKLVGLYTEVECRTSEGRVDLVVGTADYIYVMEFKLDGTAEEALRQIEERRYALRFEANGRKVFKVGVNFCRERRNIDKWLVMEE